MHDLFPRYPSKLVVFRINPTLYLDVKLTGMSEWKRKVYKPYGPGTAAYQNNGAEQGAKAFLALVRAEDLYIIFFYLGKALSRPNHTFTPLLNYYLAQIMEVINNHALGTLHIRRTLVVEVVSDVWHACF